ncbi:hypothetical protein FIBSPDRAFT_958823 [Athelia psychrophila]|uniref:Uncharacterized protein n=1 Tax=Athelia psychrophila TaxID=1759441 RepID=A0A166E7U0_9AGAM|nr:hypothetical protein FIBSPDRAFT_958823 [Fibularhizoctonia sp. CBS 109695]
MSSTQAGASSSGDAPNQSALVRLIKMASINATQSIAMPDLTLTLESWDKLKQMRRPEAYSLTQLVGLSDTELKREFLHCATRMYLMRKGWPAHPDYQRFTADPQVQTKLDTDSRERFEYLKGLKREIMKRAQGSDPKQQLELEDAWEGLRRDLRFEDVVETVAKEEIQHHSESGNLEAPTDISFASSSTDQALKNSTSRIVPGTIPDVPPSPLSYWIDLRPIEEAKADHLGHENRLLPEELPVPLSYWIDLRPIEDLAGLVLEVSPKPTSMSLELHPLDDFSPTR